MPVTETETPIPFFLPLPFPRLYNETLYSSSPIRLPRISTYEVLHFNHRCSLLCPHLYLPLAIDNANFPSLSPFRSGNSSSLSAKFIPPASIAPDTGYAFSLFDNRSLRFRRAFSRVKKRREKEKRKRREREREERNGGKVGNERNGGTKMGKLALARKRRNANTRNGYRLLPFVCKSLYHLSSRFARDPRSGVRLFVPEETRRGKRDEKAKRQLDRDAFYSRSIESMPIVTRAIVSISAKYRVSSPYSDSNWTSGGVWCVAATFSKHRRNN